MIRQMNIKEYFRYNTIKKSDQNVCIQDFVYKFNPHHIKLLNQYY